MSLTPEQSANGLPLDKDYVFAEKPADPEMRESTSLWLFEENGEFAFPRGGVEAEAHSWDNRLLQGNFAFKDGRVLNGAGRGPAPSPFDEQGRPAVLGAVAIKFQCLEPFKRWSMVFDGPVLDGHVDQQIAGTFREKAKQNNVRFEVELTMAAPAWIQDLTPEAVAKMSPADQIEAANMGIGWRFEQLVRATGTLHLDGKSRPFKGSGLRIKRQSVRPLAGFRGHTWQSAIFPDGRGFGYITYPPKEDGSQFNEAYVYQNGKMYDAKVTKVPWLRRIVGAGDDCSLELESELGATKIEGVSTLSTFRVGNPDIGGLNLQQGGVKYTWDGQVAYGMIERSAHESLTTIG